MSLQCYTSCFVNVWRLYEKNNRIYDRLLSRVHLLSKYKAHFYLSFRTTEESYEFFSAVKDIALSFYSYWEIMNFPKSISTWRYPITRSLNYFGEANASPPTPRECPSIIAGRNVRHSMKIFPVFITLLKLIPGKTGNTRRGGRFGGCNKPVQISAWDQALTLETPSRNSKQICFTKDVQQICL